MNYDFRRFYAQGESKIFGRGRWRGGTRDCCRISVDAASFSLFVFSCVFLREKSLATFILEDFCGLTDRPTENELAGVSQGFMWQCLGLCPMVAHGLFAVTTVQFLLIEIAAISVRRLVLKRCLCFGNLM